MCAAPPATENALFRGDPDVSTALGAFLAQFILCSPRLFLFIVSWRLSKEMADDEDIPPATRLRRPNFTKDELQVLLDGVDKRSRIINGKIGQHLSNENKRQAWQQITSEVNAVTGAVPIRDIEEVRRRYKDFKVRNKIKGSHDSAEESSRITEIEEILLEEIPPLKRRRPNFSEKELHALLDGVEKRAALVEGKLSPEITIEKKRHAWLEITDEINSVATTMRDIEEVRRRYKDFKSRSKSKASEKCESIKIEGSSSICEEEESVESQIICIMAEAATRGYNEGTVDNQGHTNCQLELQFEELLPHKTSPLPQVKSEDLSDSSFNEQDQEILRTPTTSPTYTKRARINRHERMVSEGLGTRSVFSGIGDALSLLVKAKAEEVAELRGLREDLRLHREADAQFKNQLLEILETALVQRNS